MNIRDTKSLKQFAAQRLANAREARKIVLIFGGSLTGIAVAVTLIQFLLDLQINKTGGLGSMGTRSILSTVKTVLPILEMIVSTCLSIGYLASMLRVARGQYVSPKTLRLGFDRFWVLFRKTLLETLIYLGVGIVSMYASMFIYMVTPLSRGMMTVLTPLLSGGEAMDPVSILSDSQIYAQIVGSMLPLFVMFLVIFCLVAIPIAYRFRMADYVLIDHPEMGAFAILRESRKIMRGNCLNLLRVDLSLWWYYAAIVLVTLIGYGDVLLPLVGLSFPWSEDAVFYLFFALYQLLQLGLCLWLRNQVETTYALSYDAIRPQPPQEGVVLGNIFQM